MKLLEGMLHRKVELDLFGVRNAARISANAGGVGAFTAASGTVFSGGALPRERATLLFDVL